MNIPKKLILLLIPLLLVAFVIVVIVVFPDDDTDVTATPINTDVGSSEDDDRPDSVVSNDDGSRSEEEEVNNASEDGSSGTALLARPAGYAPTDFISLGEPRIVSLEGHSPYEIGGSAQHIVAQGEWFAQIARCYGVPYSSLLAANPTLASPELLQPGDVVNVSNLGESGPIIGAPCVYQVEVVPNDTWLSLAAAFNIPAAELQGLNPGPLQAGQQLLVPAATEHPKAQKLAAMDLWVSAGRWHCQVGS